MVTIETAALGTRGNQLYYRNRSPKMKNLSVTSEVYIEKILEPFMTWAADRGLWQAVDNEGRGKLVGCYFMQDGKLIKIKLKVFKVSRNICF